MTLDEALKEIEKNKTEIDGLTTKVQELESVKKENETLNASVASLSEDKTKLSEKITSLETENKTLSETKTSLEASNKEVNSKLEVAHAKVEELNKEKVKSSRINSIVEKLKIEKTEAEGHYDISASLDDQNFTKWLDSTASILSKNKAEVDKQIKEEKDKLAKENLNSASAQINASEVSAENLGTANINTSKGDTLEMIRKTFSRKK